MLRILVEEMMFFRIVPAVFAVALATPCPNVMSPVAYAAGAVPRWIDFDGDRSERRH
jgi:hypothetical protein